MTASEVTFDSGLLLPDDSVTFEGDFITVHGHPVYVGDKKQEGAGKGASGTASKSGSAAGSSAVQIRKFALSLDPNKNAKIKEAKAKLDGLIEKLKAGTNADSTEVMKQLSEAVGEHDAARNGVQEQFRAHLVEALGHKSKAKLELETSNLQHEGRSAVASKAVEWFDGLLDGAQGISGRSITVYDDHDKVASGIKRSVNLSETRACYLNPGAVRGAKDDHGGVIYHPKTKAFGRNEVGIMVHEMGHAIESNDSWVHGQCVRFLERRTEGEEEKQLGGNYGDDEVVKADNFIDPYIGKMYPYQSATEVLSMGLQYLYEDPVRFAKEDPDHFDTIIKILQR